MSLKFENKSTVGHLQVAALVASVFAAYLSPLVVEAGGYGQASYYGEASYYAQSVYCTNGGNGASGTASGGDANVTGGGAAGGNGGDVGCGSGGYGGYGGYAIKTWNFTDPTAPTSGNIWQVTVGGGGGGGNSPATLWPNHNGNNGSAGFVKLISFGTTTVTSPLTSPTNVYTLSCTALNGAVLTTTATVKLVSTLLTAIPSTVNAGGTSTVSWEGPTATPNTASLTFLPGNGCAGTCGTTNLATWSTAGHLSASAPEGGTDPVIIGGNIYRFGGYTGSAYTNVISTAPVSNPTAWQNLGTTLPYADYGAGVIVAGGYVYVIGGYDGTTFHNTILQAPVSSPTSFTSIGTLPAGAPEYLPDVAVIGDAMYLFGGSTNGSTWINSIWSAPVSSPTSWAEVDTGSMTGINRPSGDGGVVVFNGNVYVMSGYPAGTNPSPTGAIWTAPLSTFTNNTTWTSAGTFAAGTGFGHGMRSFVLGNTVYVVGGNNNAGTWNNTVRHQSSPPGNFSIWAQDTSTGGLSYSRPIVIGNSIYLFGGYSSVTAGWTNNIQSAQIASTSGSFYAYSMQPWETDSSDNTAITWPLSNNTTYTLTYTPVGSTATTANAIVTVNQPPTATLGDGNTATTSQGTAFNITWTSSNATSCTLGYYDPSGTNHPSWFTGLSGSQAAGGTFNTLGTYHVYIDCTGPAGSTHVDLYHGITSTGLPSGMSLTVAARVRKNAAATLNWSVTGMSGGMSCLITPANQLASNGKLVWDGISNPFVGATSTVPITQPTTYTLTCGNGTASSTAQATVKLVPTVQEI